MALQSLFVVNKAGSLIFYRKFSESSPAVSPNDQLHLASTFHGAFTAAYTDVFFVTADLKTENLAGFLREIYSLYADYVMKNPFYELDMPIKCDQWEAHLRTAVEQHNRVFACDLNTERGYAIIVSDMAYQPMIRFRYALQKAAAAAGNATASASGRAVASSGTPASATKAASIPSPPGVVRTSQRIQSAPPRMGLNEFEMEVVMTGGPP